MEKDNKNPHAGHRARMRQKVEENGIASLPPHEAIEYLLYHAIPRRDVNALSHALLEKGGSLPGALRAENASLAGKKAAEVLSAIGDCAAYYAGNADSARPVATREILNGFSGRRGVIVPVDAGGRISAVLPIAPEEGSEEKSGEKPEEKVLRDALLFSAWGVWVIPGQETADGDRRVAEALRRAGVRVIGI